MTLSDEDINSILTDNANRVFQGNALLVKVSHRAFKRQKKSKSKRLFLTQGIPKSKIFALFVKVMTQILCQKKFITFSERKYGQNHGQCSEKVELGLSKGRFFVW